MTPSPQIDETQVAGLQVDGNVPPKVGASQFSAPVPAKLHACAGAGQSAGVAHDVVVLMEQVPVM
jgi:hypothetical protein